jgi:hypothetical protein
LGSGEIRSPDLYCEQLRPVVVIATLLQHLTHFRKRTASRCSGRLFRVSAACPEFWIFCPFWANYQFFVVLTGLEPVTSPM